MATTQSATKRWRQSLIRRDRHRQTRTQTRSAIRAAREAAESGDLTEYQSTLSTAYSVLDRAVRKGAIVEGKANRLKRRLAALAENPEATTQLPPKN